MKLINLLWATRERPVRDEADARLKLYGRRSFWRTGARSGWRA